MPLRPEILLADDERVMRLKYRRLFESEGFAVREAKDGEEAVAAFFARRPDVTVLDMMMPVLNGMEACREIRAHDPGAPVLFLSCVPDDTKKLRAYDAGADDYVEKGTNDDLLVAKVRALLRRASAAAETPASAPPTASRIRLGTVEVDRKSRAVFFSGRPACTLTQTERDVLAALDARRGQTLSRDELIAALRGEGFACEDSMLYVHVSNLRKKLGAAADLLRSTRDAGYALLA